MKKSLNDILNQFSRCFNLNANRKTGRKNRIEEIIKSMQNARIIRGLSKFDENRDLKKEIINFKK